MSGTAGPVLVARALFAVNGAAWILLGIVSLVRLASADGTGVPWIVAVLMFGNAAALAWLAWVLGKRRTVWYLVAVAVLAVNILLSVTDEFGLLDLVVLLADGALLILLLAARTRFLPVQTHKTDGEAMTHERRRSF
jgi:hypothetical protein